MAYIQTLFCIRVGDHDVEQTMCVYRNTHRIVEEEPGCDVEIAALAALLHDADGHSHNLTFKFGAFLM